MRFSISQPIGSAAVTLCITHDSPCVHELVTGRASRELEVATDSTTPILQQK
jgi:hypothetical protein